MKLVIDIDEDIYKSMKNTKYIGNEKGLVETIANGTPLKEELEKMKEKINLEDVDCQYEDDYVYSSGLQKAIELIDNRIEELKGETE